MPHSYWADGVLHRHDAVWSLFLKTRLELPAQVTSVAGPGSWRAGLGWST